MVYIWSGPETYDLEVWAQWQNDGHHEHYELPSERDENAKGGNHGGCDTGNAHATHGDDCYVHIHDDDGSSNNDD